MEVKRDVAWWGTRWESVGVACVVLYLAHHQQNIYSFAPALRSNATQPVFLFALAQARAVLPLCEWREVGGEESEREVSGRGMKGAKRW